MISVEIKELVMELTGEKSQRSAAKQFAADMGFKYGTIIKHMGGIRQPDRAYRRLYQVLRLKGPGLYRDIKKIMNGGER